MIMEKSEIDNFKIANSSFIQEDGNIVFSDGTTHKTQVIINVDNITMLARQGEDKTIIHFVSGDCIIIDKQFTESLEFIKKHCNFLGSINM